MPLPDVIPPFAQIAEERFQDARALLEQGRTTGSAYLSSYVVECALKSILMDVLPENKVKEVYAQFRVKGHDVKWLTRQLAGRRVGIPAEIEKCLEYFHAEPVGLRYSDQAIDVEVTGRIFASAGTVLEWGKLVELQIVELNQMVRRVNDLFGSRYKADHPDASITVYSIPDEVRLRVVDPAFEGKHKMDRIDMVWPYLLKLTQRDRLYIGLMLLITPEEREFSMANYEFDDAIGVQS